MFWDQGLEQYRGPLGGCSEQGLLCFNDCKLIFESMTRKTGERRAHVPRKNARGSTEEILCDRNVRTRGEDRDVEFLKGTSFDSAKPRRIAWGTVTHGFVHNMICCSICGILLFGVTKLSEKEWRSYESAEKPLYALSNPLLRCKLVQPAAH